MSVESPLSLCPSCQYSCQKVFLAVILFDITVSYAHLVIIIAKRSESYVKTSCDIVTSYRDVIWRQMAWSKSKKKVTFFNMETLTFDLELDLRTHPRCYQGQYSHQILGSYLKRFSRDSAE